MDASFYTRKVRYALCLIGSLVLLFLLGMAGFMLLEGVSIVDALYLTIGTLTTVAPFTLSEGGRVFAIILLICGFGLVASTAAFIGNMFLDGSGVELYRRRKVRKRLQQFEDHYIVCGHGQMGQVVVAELARKNISLVVIDTDEQALSRCKELGLAYFEGDAMEEDSLIEAGIARAKGLISVVDGDANNLFIVVTARALRPDIFISARASSKGVEKKLYRAGADHVVSPYASAAIRITQNILRPAKTDFLELALSGEGVELALKEVTIPPESPFADMPLTDTNIQNDYDLIIVAIKRRDGTQVYNPSSFEPVRGGDTLIAIGPQANLDRLLEQTRGGPAN